MHFTQLSSVERECEPNLQAGSGSHDSGPARIPGPNMPNRKTDPPILYLLLNDILGVLSDQFTSFPKERNVTCQSLTKFKMVS